MGHFSHGEFYAANPMPQEKNKIIFKKCKLKQNINDNYTDSSHLVITIGTRNLVIKQSQSENSCD